MALASIEPKMEERAAVGRLGRICGGLALLGLAGWLGLSLGSWNVADPSLSHAGTTEVTNLAGGSGAVVADLAMQILGLSSVLLVVFPTVWSLILVADRRIGQMSRRGWMAAGGLVLSAAALGCLSAPAGWPLPIGLGGITGDLALRVPSLITGAYPSGVFGAVLAILLGLPAGWLSLYGAGLLKPARAETIAATAPSRRGAVADPYGEEEDAPGRLQLAAGAMGHAVYSLGAALSRRVGSAARRDREPELARHAEPVWEASERRADPSGLPPAPAPRMRAEREVRVVEPRMEEYPQEDPAARYVPRQAVPVAPRPAAPAPAFEPAPFEEAPFEPLAAEPPRRPVDTSRATVRHGRSDWNGSVAASRLGQPRGLPTGRDGEPEFEELEESLQNLEAAFEHEDPQAGFEPEEAAPAWAPEPEPAQEATLSLDADDRIQPVEPAREDEDGGWLNRAANIVAFPGMRRKAEAPVAAPAPLAAPAMRAPQAPAARVQQPSMADHQPRVVPTAPAQVQSRQAAQPQRVYQGEPAHAYAPEYFELPPIDLLSPPKARSRDDSLSPEMLQENARLLEGVLDDFGVKGEIIEVRPGPVVTLYELEPAPGIKSSRVIGLADDIARSMSAIAARVAVIPGKNAIGIELPNARRETVYFREMIGSQTFGQNKAKLALALGKTIGGEAVIADLAKMPHLLVAGTTGSGKSVSINTMILSLLYKLTPAECRMIMIDPKMLELSIYDGIPHLLSPVVTDPKKAVVALKWTVREMEDRYRKMSKVGVRNIDGFNTRVRQAMESGETISRTVQTGFDRETGEPIFESEEFDLSPLPYIVVIIDEMADLMMVAGKEIEGTVQRLAQMARAAGIHVIMATQRPSVDVITGTIKANFPTRISFQVTSKIDSRTILQEQGAEQLLGQGDMLFMAGGGRIQRVHGPFVADEEVEQIVAHLKTQGLPDYLDSILEDEDEEEAGAASGGKGGDTSGLEESGDLYDQAVAVVLRDGKASTSYVQRRLGIGYNRAASLIERMEKEGLIGPANHAGKREILVPTDNA